jgi:glyoxylase-like metal-dependent hydrolase (beta-lactamase superfamily II)
MIRSFWRRALLAAGLVTIFVGAAQAGAPQQKTQVPGWYRTMVGTLEVTALYDGYFQLDPHQLLKNAHPGEIDRDLARAFIPGPTVQTSVNGFLVNTGSQLILVDAGTGGMMGQTAGHLVDNLKASGYTPDQVDVVLLTHLHGDHVGGVLTAVGKPAFPNAQLMVSAPEAAFWLDAAHKAKAPKDMQAFFDMATKAVAPYQASGHWKTFAPNSEVLPGVRAVATGHTPGHSSYLFTSGGQKLLVTGDIVHIGAVQFADPDVAANFDTDSKPAIASRKRVWSEAAKDGTLLASAHVSFPGLGHVRADGKGFVWVPLPYSPIDAGQKAAQ